MELYPEEEDRQPDETPLYTAEDTPKKESVGDYSILKTVTAVATGNPPPEGDINFDQHVDESWKQIAPEQNALDMEAAMSAAAKRQDAIAQNLMEQVRARNVLIGSQTEQTQAAVRAKLHDLASSAIETNAASTHSILINNTPAEVASVTQEGATRMSAAASLDKKLKDATSIGSILTGLGYELTPFAAEQGPAIDRVAIAHGVDPAAISRMTGRNKTIQHLGLVYQGIPEEKKTEWLDGLFNDLVDSALITKLQAAHVVGSVAAGSQVEAGNWEDWLDRLGVAGTLISAATMGLKIGKIGKGISAAEKVERTIAKAGAKATLEAAETTRVVNSVKNRMRLEQLGVAAGELTGVTAAMDLSKLITVNALKILPESIGTAAETIMKPIRADIDKLVNNLQDTVAAKGIRSEEVASQVEAMRTRFSPAQDKHIHSADPITMSADGTILATKVTYKPENASAFLTKEGAEQFIKSRGMQNAKVVPDTTNTKFLVEEKVVEDLMARKLKLESEIATAIAAEKTAMALESKGIKLAGTGRVAQVAMPKAVAELKMTNTAFESPLDKALALYTSDAKQAVDARKEVESYIKKLTGWDDATINAKSNALRESVLNTPADEAGVKVIKTINETKTMSTQWPGSGMAQRLDTRLYDQFNALARNGKLTGRMVGNTKVIGGAPTEVDMFVNTLGKRLGMEDHPMIVMDYVDLREGFRNKALSFEEAHIYNLATKTIAKGAHGMAFNYGDAGKVIVMNMPKQNIAMYMETFAHEYGHAFEGVWTHKNFELLDTAFNNWLKSKGVTSTKRGTERLIGELPPEAFMEFRSLSVTRQAADVQPGEVRAWVHRWLDGDMEHYAAIESNLHDWLRQYSEFFAENFSKWAFTSEVPTTVLGQAFKHVVDGWKEIAAFVAQRFKSITGAMIKRGVGDVTAAEAIGKVDVEYVHPTIKRYLDDMVKSYEQVAVSAAKAPKVGGKDKSMARLIKDLEAVDNHLQAIEDARSGLKTGWLVERDATHTITYADIGKYAEEDINSVARWALNDWALTTSHELYGQRVLGIKQESRYSKLMESFIGDSISKLSKAERGALDSTLVLGDKEGKVFSEVELAGQGLTEKSRAAYYRVRALRDIMHQVRNDIASKSMTRRGFVEITKGFAAEDGGKVFGKEVTPADGKMIYLADDKKVAMMNDNFRKEMVKKGYVIYEMPQAMEVDGKWRKTIAIKRSDLEFSQITEVIPYRTGEYRRIYSDEYFVKIRSTNEVDGVAEEVVSTHRTATSNKEAAAYVEALKTAHSLFKAGKLDVATASRLMEGFGWKPEDLIASFTDGRFPPEFKAEIRFNRNDDDYVNEIVGLSTNYSSKRGDKVLSVHGEDAVNTLSPIDSISSEISNTAYVASTTEWRESHIQRWFNTFREDLPLNVQSMNPQEAFLYMLNNKGFYIRDNKRMLFAENVQDYLISQLNIPTKEEKITQGFAVRMSEMFENSGLGKIPFLGPMMTAKMRSTKDPAKFAKSLAFHSFFALNPVQFVMQTINAFNAFALHPVEGLNAARKSLWYGAALMSDQESVWREMAKANKIASLGFSDAEEFVQAVRVMKRSGLFADLAGTSLMGAGKTGVEVVSGGKKMALNASSFFFNMGEGNARLISFEIARKDWMAKNAGKAWWSDEAIEQIMKQQDTLTQNMTRANTAKWQKGLVSVPLQFAQYPIKFALNVIQGLMGNKRTFTKKQLAQLMAMHAVFFGTEGNLMPFRDEVNAFLDKNVENDRARLLLQQGVVSAAISAITNDDLQIGFGARFNTTRYYEDLIDGLFDPEKKFLEVAGGPAGFIVTRAYDQVSKGVSIMAKAPMSMETMKIGLIEMGKTFTAINNMQKAKIAQANYNIVTSKAGADLYKVKPYDTWAMALGFPSVTATDFSNAYKSAKDYQTELKAAGETIGYHANLALVALNNNDEEAYKVHSAVVQVVLNAYSGPDYASLLKSAYKTVGFTKYKKLLVQHAQNDWEVKALQVDTEGN